MKSRLGWTARRGQYACFGCAHCPDPDLVTGEADGSRCRLVEILESYLDELEHGAPDPTAVIEANPELADELKPYLESLRLLDGATRAMRAPNEGALEYN